MAGSSGVPRAAGASAAPEASALPMAGATSTVVEPPPAARLAARCRTAAPRTRRAAPHAPPQLRSSSSSADPPRQRRGVALGTRKPVVPSTIPSGMPPTGEPTTGTPGRRRLQQHHAEPLDPPGAGAQLGSTSIAARRIHASTSACGRAPRNRTRSPNPSRRRQRLAATPAAPRRRSPPAARRRDEGRAANAASRYSRALHLDQPRHVQHRPRLLARRAGPDRGAIDPGVVQRACARAGTPSPAPGRG